MTLPVRYSVLCFGQSNMAANQWAMASPGPWPSASENEHGAILTFRNGVVYPADADLPGDSNDNGIGQAAARFCKRLLDDSKSGRIWCLNRGKGATSITDSLPGEDLYDDCLADVASLGLRPEYVLFSQGEQDHAQTATWWYDHFETFYDAIVADYPTVTKIFLFKTAAGACGNNVDTIRTAQDDCATDFSLVTLIDLDDLTDVDETHGGCHYNYNGYKEFGDRAFDAI